MAGLDWLKTPIQFAKGVGPRLSEMFGRLNIGTFEDVLYHLPFRYLNRSQIFSMDDLIPGKNRTVCGEIYASGAVTIGRKGRKIFEAILSDGKGQLIAKWFNFPKNYFQNRFVKGEKFLFFGEVSIYRGEKQMIHPEVQRLSDFFDQNELENFLGLVPVYSLTEGLYQRQIRKIIYGVLGGAESCLQETLPAYLLEEMQLPGLLESFERVHQPRKEDPIELFQNHRSDYHRRLVFEEFFYLQIGLGLRKRNQEKIAGFAHRPIFHLREKFLSQLPFELTSGQMRAIEEITGGMCRPQPMNMLLQGDVGSGKTLVGLTAALLAVENRCQAAIMVPTEILAEQHAGNFRNLLNSLEVPVYLLTASTKGSDRERIISRLKEGEPALVVGTHALLEEDVSFSRLSLIIIDEQHRFGVRQRMKLMLKGELPDVLVMTATPIPRSLAMTLYGDLDLCLMTEMPKGRKPVITRIMNEKNRPKLYDFIRKKIMEGQQAYFVLPLIEESEKIDLKNATQAFKILKKEFPEFSIALLHGRMKNVEKEEIMRQFSRGELNILVATTVIEVGIDVPNATLMIIEHAERFGLSQLHQLRGRVGRGSEKSYCILAVAYRQSDLARERLKVMEENTDGFKIAEEDLKIRGPGDFLGTRQSGIPDFRVANLVTDLDLLASARLAAGRVLEQDPHLSQPENLGMAQVLLHRWQGRLGLAGVG